MYLNIMEFEIMYLYITELLCDPLKISAPIVAV